MKIILQKLGITSWQDLKKFVVQFLKFGIVGLSNTFVSLAVYYLFVYIHPSLYLVGNTVGFVVSVVNAFYWSNKYVFRSQDNTWKQLGKRLLKTYLTYASTFLLSSALLFLEVRVWGISEWLAPVINLIVTIPLNFLLNKFWAFK